MWSRSKIIAAIVAVVVGLPLAFVLVSKYVKVNLDVVADPLEYVTVIDNDRPGSGLPLKILERLDVDTKTKWHGRLFQDHLETYGGESLKANRQAIAQRVTVPKGKDANLFGVATNALDQSSVAANGTFSLLWFGYPPSAEAWLKQDNEIFSDQASEKVRQTYWTGSFVFYYSPPAAGGKDWTSELPAYLGQVAICSSGAESCPNALTPSPGTKG